ncbi:MAG: DUF1641 domain-containing protein [Pirellulales bacterium]
MASQIATQSAGAVSTDVNADCLQRRLSDPKVTQGLNRLLDRVDSIAFAVEAFEGFVARGDVIANSVATAVAEFKTTQEDSGQRVSLKEILEQTPEMIDTGKKLASVSKQAHLDDLEESRLLERITQPETLQTLNRLLDKLPIVALLLESLDGFIRRSDTIAENVAGMVHELKLSESKISLEKLISMFQSLPKLQEMGEHLLQSGLADEGLPKVVDAGVSMINSGMLDKDVVAVLGELGRASVHTFVDVKKQNPPPIGGLWSMMKATKDPDVQKSLGFFFAFAKAFSKNLS